VEPILITVHENIMKKQLMTPNKVNNGFPLRIEKVEAFIENLDLLETLIVAFIQLYRKARVDLVRKIDFIYSNSLFFYRALLQDFTNQQVSNTKMIILTLK
jgi:hypothetical protein